MSIYLEVLAVIGAAVMIKKLFRFLVWIMK